MNNIFRAVILAGALAVSLGSSLAAAEQEMPIVQDELIEDETAPEADPLTRAQQLLIELGYLNGAADGIYGPNTRAALEAFQTRQGLEVTGQLDDATLQALEGMAQTVSRAKEIQQRLIDLGYLRGTADGIFGERSQTALRQFQALNGLEANAQADETTLEKLFSGDVQALPARLGAGDKGDEVVALQEKLAQYGFMAGDVDGSYGKQTLAGVKRFQQRLLDQGVDPALGIEASGEATPVTLMLLYDPDYSSYIADVAAGEESEEVARVERRLILLGYMDAEADGALDDYAVAAARAFQEAADQDQGAFGRAFIDALFSADAVPAERFVPHDIAYGDRGMAVRAVETALLQGGLTIRTPSGEFKDSLKSGLERLYDYLRQIDSPRAVAFADPTALSIGAQQLLTDGLLNDTDVVPTGMIAVLTTRIQRRLHTLYYLPRYSVDGEYGDNTRRAMEGFQQDNGLPVTGNPDRDALRLLFSADVSCKQFPYRVEVDIDRQRVYVFQLNEAGEYEKIKTFVCSTGLKDSTPRGIFLNGGPGNAWHHFKKFDCWAQYSFEIEGDILFHSVLFDEKDPETLREGSLYALGQKASHGCVRLTVKDAKWLFEHCKYGSLVILIY